LHLVGFLLTLNHDSRNRELKKCLNNHYTRKQYTALSTNVFVLLAPQMKHFPVADAKTRMLKSARTLPAATTLIIRLNIRQTRDKIIFLELNIYLHCLRGICYPRHGHYHHFYAFFSSRSSWLRFVFIIIMNWVRQWKV